ncbi:hypothetical protein LC040_12160 [Bacillus tianshenii]|nr:hypothetical protein LC040_12160 [Bacillus tianshenii]
MNANYREFSFVASPNESDHVVNFSGEPTDEEKKVFLKLENVIKKFQPTYFEAYDAIELVEKHISNISVRLGVANFRHDNQMVEEMVKIFLDEQVLTCHVTDYLRILKNSIFTHSLQLTVDLSAIEEFEYRSAMQREQS